VQGKISVRKKINGFISALKGIAVNAAGSLAAQGIISAISDM